ncbi:YciI family protein [Clostridiaceae bacterium M8S5]|nr:YciI family protein [Clostridiaceae bacterium M8S5]
MNKGDVLYVRTDTKIEGAKVTRKDYDDHIEYLTEVSKQRYLMGGGYVNNPGGMIVFSAKDIQDAHNICRADPLISRKLYCYELLEWEIVLYSN